MNVIDLLKEDHQHVAGLFAQYKAETEGPLKHDILKAILRELKVHASAEEEVVYSELAIIDQEKTKHAAEEHDRIMNLMTEVDMAPAPTHATYVAKLEAEVTHHVEEEEGSALPLLENSLTDDQLEELGRKFVERKSEI
jgi:hypothetical protein